MSTSNFVNISSPDQFKEELSKDLNRVSLLNFWAPWAEPCAAFNKAVEEAAAKYPSVLFLNVSFPELIGADWQIEAEEQADIAESFDIEAVPSFVVLRVSSG